MTRRARLLCALLPPVFFALLSCGGERPPVPETAAPLPDDAPSPASASFAAAVRGAAFARIERLDLPGPFPRSLRAGAASLELRFDGGELFAYGPVPDESSTIARDVEDWGEAVRGDYRYELSDDGALRASVHGDHAADGTEAEAREVWRYKPAARVSAGPIAFDDVVLAATDSPALIALDRSSGALVDERPLSERLYGPLVFLEGARLLAALGVDGTLLVYTLRASGDAELDPVEAVLRPKREAAARIEKRLAERLGLVDSSPSVVYLPYGPRDALPESGAAIFRYDVREARKSRVYVDGAASRPVLVEVFSAGGESLATNLDYVGLDAVVEFSFAEGPAYFIAAAFLAAAGEDGAAPSRPARLVVAPK